MGIDRRCPPWTPQTIRSFTFALCTVVRTVGFRTPIAGMCCAKTPCRLRRQRRTSIVLGWLSISAFCCPFLAEEAHKPTFAWRLPTEPLMVTGLPSWIAIAIFRDLAQKIALRCNVRQPDP